MRFLEKTILAVMLLILWGVSTAFALNDPLGNLYVTFRTPTPTPTGSATPTPTNTVQIAVIIPTPDLTKVAGAALQLTQVAQANLQLTAVGQPWLNGGVWTPTNTATATPTGSATPTPTSTGVIVSNFPTIDLTKVAGAALQLTQVAQLGTIASNTGATGVDARTFAVGVSQVITGSLTNPVVLQVYNPVGSGVTLSLVRCMLNATIQSVVFGIARSGAPVTLGASATPVVYQVSAYDSTYSTAAAVTGVINAQPTPPTFRAIGYGFIGSNYTPWLIPYDTDSRARRHTIKPGEALLIRIIGTTSSGTILGVIVFSEN